MTFVVSYFEGDYLHRLPFRQWWHFLWVEPVQLLVPNPGRNVQPYQFKCLAAVLISKRMIGYDFVIGRIWRRWEAERKENLKLPDCPDNEAFDHKKHSAYRRDSTPFHSWHAWQFHRFNGELK